ncbi:DUF2784 domain-containing protein [Bordetella flabilis]|uniref:DUF2784 domain-containing protein n=1 Tax=Bordetella flabilis TaxID=463014 RepID=A0A193GBG2_9BORD|nr:DUF2784 domain-containing protein [Bordetella flabilis]ANN76968.1 hypothetical protein BAU07_07460 [Bordetella flabilis]
MIYRVLADAVLVAHGLFVAWVVFGGLAAFWRRRAVWLHLPALAWGVAIAGMGWICPLTPLENSLRERAGLQGYAGSFIGQYLLPLIYPAALTRDIQVLLAVLLLGGNVVVYALLYWRTRGRRT